jgi:hypothetical protein
LALIQKVGTGTDLILWAFKINIHLMTWSL